MRIAGTQQQLGSTQYPMWYPGLVISPLDIYAFIHKAALARGMNVIDVLTVIDNEGGWKVPTLRNYAGEPAWGPLQLHVVAEDFRPGFEAARATALANPCNGYVGDQFICKTGLHPSEIRAYKMAIEFGLDYAIKLGDWSAWYGAKFLADGRFTRVVGNVLGFSDEAKAFAGVL